MDDNKIWHEATRLIQLGYRVFPCIPNGKSPATTHGVKDATTDEATLENWFAFGDFNLAVSTDGLIVVDVDPLKPDATTEQVAAREAWLTENQSRLYYQAAAVTQTPRGGAHYWFHAPAGSDYRNTTSKISLGVDTRANGGYVLVPPSTIDGKAYSWLVEPSTERSDAPDWLLAMLDEKPASNLDEASKGRTDAQQGIAEGSRNGTLTSIGGTMRRYGSTFEEIEAALLIRNRAACRPPLDDAEVKKIAWSVSRYEPDRAATAVAERKAEKPLRVLTLSELKSEFPRQREPIIEGLCRPGEVVNVIAKSKVGKSWTTYGLAFSVITAQPWLGKFGCRFGKVLLVDNELLPETLAARLSIVQRKLTIPDDIADNLHAVSLRGNNLDIFGIGSLLTEDIAGRYAVVILDCFYKFLPAGISENDNAAMGQVYCALERYAARTNAVIVVVHHATKGNQDGKDVVDVGSGASALSRSADSHVILRPHEEPGCVVMESAVRSFPPNDPVVLQFEFPLWLPAGGLSPDALQNSRTAKENAKKAERLEAKRQAIVEYLTEADVAKVGATKSAIRDNTGGNGMLMEAIRSLVKDKTIMPVAVVNPANNVPYDGWVLASNSQQADSRTAGGFSESSACPGRGGSVSDGQLLRNSVRLPPELPPDGSVAKENYPAAPEDAGDNLMPNGRRRKKTGKRATAATGRRPTQPR